MQEEIEDEGYRISVLYEDNHIIAVNKPAGILVQADKTGDKPLLDVIKDYIKTRDDKPGGVFLGCVHRLDRPVSGVILFAKTSKALERINSMFKKREVQKTYWAVVKHLPAQKEGHLAHWLIKDPKINMVKAHPKEVPGSQFSELDYGFLKTVSNYFLLEIRPLTGRPHQIRVQLSAMGCPIRGDKKYGYPKGNSNGSINLHARKIRFTHPVKREPLEIEAPLPKDTFWKTFELGD